MKEETIKIKGNVGAGYATQPSAILKVTPKGNYGIGTTVPQTYIQLNANSLWDAWKKLLRFTFIDLHITISMGEKLKSLLKVKV